MSFDRRTPQLLHDDHQATIIVIETLEQMLSRAKRSIPDATDPSVKKSLQTAASAIEEEISAHFTFEEEELFTRLADAGDGAIGAHLAEEHKAILPLGIQMAALARAALDSGFTDTGWSEFRAVTSELIERMIPHIQKEEMALLPILDDLLDPKTDMELSTAYAEIQ